jgi:hypothetical protein
MKPFTRAALSDAGFTGWITFDRLSTASPCPKEGGVYVVCRTEIADPKFTEQSCGGWFKNRNPTVSLDALRANWVEGADIVYIGKANDLRRRLGEFAKFGAGKPIGHWGGRLIWQLLEAPTLIVGWKATPDRDPESVEGEMIAHFRSTFGKPPFANEPQMMGR